MKEERIIRSTLGDVREDRTDWARVDAMTDEEIEEAARADPDAQPTDEEFWKHAKIITPPPRKDIHMRVDEDVLDWFKKQGRGYQAHMNAVLRAYMKAKSSESEKHSE
jgi:uncharacterized protein (DUF4415 family)